MPIPDQPGNDKTQTAYASECSRNPTRRLAGVPACSKANHEAVSDYKVAEIVEPEGDLVPT